MLSVHQLSKSFNLKTLFKNVTFHINAGERVALIGPNGTGKTTLARIVTGEESADSGTIILDQNRRLGYLPQGFELNPTRTLAETLTQEVDLDAQLANLAIQLSETPANEALQTQFDAVLQKLEHNHAGDQADIAHALGLGAIDPNLQVDKLSGGQKTRLALALLLQNQPDLLLLDEPTNHLDITMLEWLEEWLLTFRGGILFISHDRTFIDRVATKILYLDEHEQTVREYVGTYSDFIAQWEAEREKQLGRYLDQIAEEKRIKQEMIKVMQHANRYEKMSKHDFQRRKAKEIAKTAKARETKLEKYLDSAERVSKPTRSWQMNVGFGDNVHSGKSVLHLENLVVGYNKPLVSIKELYITSGQRIVLTGANGSGKTTLLKTIAERLPTLAGTITLGSSIKLGYMAQEQDILDMTLTPVQTLQASGFGTDTEIRTYLHNYLFKDDEPLKPNHLLSYGQRARLQLALLVASGCNFLLLDEPINHLDIPSRELFEQALLNFGGTTLAVVHDRYFIKRFASEIWWVEGGSIRREGR